MLKAEPKFRGRFPWWGADLQTLRDTLRPPRLPQDQGIPVTIALADGASLLAFHDRLAEPLGLVLLLHGLGGSSDREGLRRLGVALQAAGFEVLRLNLRGRARAGPWPPAPMRPIATATSCRPWPAPANWRRDGPCLG